MASTSTVVSTLLTVRAWCDLDEDTPGELVDGRLEDEEVPTVLHEAIVSWIVAALHGWLAPRGGWVFGSETKLVVGPTRGRKPDVCAYFPGAPLPRRDARASRIPPSIAVEVVSPRPRDVQRDRVEKKREYAAFGVRFYWLVDPNARTFEIFERDAAGRYRMALTASCGVPSIPGCDGLTLDLDALWTAVDRLPMGGDSADVELGD